MKLSSHPRLKLKQNLFKLALISFLVVIIWIAFEIFWVYNQQDSSQQISLNVEPITSELYIDQAGALGNRLSFTSQELEAFKLRASTLPNPDIQSTLPSATPSAGLTASPSATTLTPTPPPASPGNNPFLGQ